MYNIKKNIKVMLGVLLLPATLLTTSCVSEIEDGTTDIDNWPTARIDMVIPETFQHPGILHTSSDLDRLRTIAQSGQGIAYECYRKLAASNLSQSNYNMQGPFEELTSDLQNRFGNDFSAAWQNAIMYITTGDASHAEKSVEIIMAYANTVKLIKTDETALSGSGVTPLFTSNVGLKLIYAAELMRYRYPQGMTDANFEKAQALVRKHFVPVYDAFYAEPPYTNGNWGASVTKAYLASAILLDDIEMYKRAIEFYLYAVDNGNIRYYLDIETGQCQESGRDQQHVQLGLEGLAATCEIAWKQGTDLYSVMENKLQKGYEYTAKYNLGYEVPYKVWQDVTVAKKYSNWQVISADRRGEFRPIYEQVYNHYVGRKGLSMPYTKQVVEKARSNPETMGEGYHFDHIAYGTFLFNESDL